MTCEVNLSFAIEAVAVDDTRHGTTVLCYALAKALIISGINNFIAPILLKERLIMGNVSIDHLLKFRI